MSKPSVGISQCLLGDLVRYDGGHKRDAELLHALSPVVEWVPVCPEVEVGMGTPREPIQLVSADVGVPSRSRRVRLVGVDSGEDWTERMMTFSRARIAALASQRICGFVLKKDSPSCGIDDVRILAAAGVVTRNGRGVFAEVLLSVLPDLPIADEQLLHDRAVQERFVRDVRDYQARHFGIG